MRGTIGTNAYKAILAAALAIRLSCTYNTSAGVIESASDAIEYGSHCNQSKVDDTSEKIRAMGAIKTMFDSMEDGTVAPAALALTTMSAFDARILDMGKRSIAFSSANPTIRMLGILEGTVGDRIPTVRIDLEFSRDCAISLDDSKGGRRGGAQASPRLRSWRRPSLHGGSRSSDVRRFFKSRVVAVSTGSAGGRDQVGVRLRRLRGLFPCHRNSPMGFSRAIRRHGGLLRSQAG